MAKPATLPTWDTNATNVATPSAGALSDGFVAGDRPPAKWWNWLFYWITQWIAYQNTSRTRKIVINAVDGAISSGFAVDTDGYLELAASASGACYFGLPVRVGDKVKSFRVLCQRTDGTNGGIDCYLYRLRPTTSLTPVEVVTGSSTATAAVQAVGPAFTEETCGADDSFYIAVIGSNSTGTKRVFSVEIEVETP